MSVVPGGCLGRPNETSNRSRRDRGSNDRVAPVAASGAPPDPTVDARVGIDLVNDGARDTPGWITVLGTAIAHRAGRDWVSAGAVTHRGCAPPAAQTAAPPFPRSDPART